MMTGAQQLGSGNRRKMRSRVWAAIFAPVLLAGCIFSSDQGRPDRARLNLEGGASSSMELIVSTDFLVVDGSVSFQRADTAMVSVPFNETYSLAQPARIYIRAVNIQTQTEVFGMKVWIDGESWYDESRSLEPGEAFEFLYRYNEPGIR